MKIDDSLKKTAGLGVNTTPARAGKGADKAGAVSQAPAESGKVHLSSKLESLTQMGGSSVFDAKKVEEIKAAIAEGRFQVDAEKVANGLLDTVSDLIRTRKA
ncbi:flagellar biosynthesis anti-sigma factor FlgM [Noviherbaspirillum denitrificans]|uniref:Negative regulator of flagellin synthesis n=1 Tax=Noviherbaspirillum denitrificans TaxID=1968433 RepID=A0A254TF89_9BURK|nr:flagellar biosynthesis anti-sigma factor FlgM [Noviherbaspirillum denitrificans]OWW19982.1 flagellar biosynthesis anti-sigma factor FlgM [Noviherbaspirillum denitrificans]